MLLGGVEIGTDTLLRWYVLHVLLFPFVIVIFMAIHFWRVRKDGGIWFLRNAIESTDDWLTEGSGGSAAVIGVGVNGRAAARTFKALGRDVVLWDVERRRSARRGGRSRRRHRPAASSQKRLVADAVVTVTPGRKILIPEGSLRPGQHVSLMGADGPGEGGDRGRRSSGAHRFFATSGSRRAAAASSLPQSRREQSRKAYVTELGNVLTGDAEGRTVARRDHDLRLDRSCNSGSRDCDRRHERADELDLPRMDF